MVGRFFALEMGCPNEDASQGGNGIKTVAYLNDDGSLTQAPASSQNSPDSSDGATADSGSDSGSGDEEGEAMICECRGMGCDKCKNKRRKKKIQIFTLTGNPGAPLPVLNMPMGPGGPSMVMMGRPRFF